MPRSLRNAKIQRIFQWTAATAIAILILIALHFDQPQVVRRIFKSRPLHPLAGVTIVLDPGHGGADSGAVCREIDARGHPAGRLTEATLNYRLASETATVLRNEGATVVWTVSSRAILLSLHDRQLSEPPLIVPADAHLLFNGAPVRLRAGENPDDLYRRAAVTLPLWNRRKRADGNGFYYLSMHCDMFEPGVPGHGARVYHDKREPLCPRFATILKRRLTLAGLTNSNRGTVIARNLGVLNRGYNAIPERALLEAATLSDIGDRKAVETSVWRWRLAHLIADSIVECEGE